MKICVIGGTGHIGSYLVPRLVMAGHEVKVVARHPCPRYSISSFGWGKVSWILVDDRQKGEQDGSWKKLMESLEVDVVIDLLCFTPEQNRLMVKAFKGRIRHFLHCGSIWAYGPTLKAPYQENFPRRPISRYGINKAKIEADLIKEYQTNGFPATIIHPGHISGRKWLPIDPQGAISGVGVYEKLARGEVVELPDSGLATLHHVHADDLAQLFQRAIERRNESVGEVFSGVAPYAMSLLGIAEFVASLFGKKANFKFVPLAEMEKVLDPKLGALGFPCTKEHVTMSPCCSIEKARRLLGYEPHYTTEEIYKECIEYQIEIGALKV